MDVAVEEISASSTLRLRFTKCEILLTFDVELTKQALFETDDEDAPLSSPFTLLWFPFLFNNFATVSISFF